MAHAEAASRKRQTMGGMPMDDGTVAGGSEGRPIPPRHHPARPRIECRRLSTSLQPLERRAEMARTPQGNKPKLPDRVRETIRIRHYSIRTEEAYVSGIKRSILFHAKSHP